MNSLQKVVRTMSDPALTLERIRERGLQVLREQLGIVAMVGFLQQTQMGWGITRRSGIDGTQSGHASRSQRNSAEISDWREM